MVLSEQASLCLRMLENAGFAAYAVGGCVRDDLLGIAPHDFDLCTAALPEQTQQIFSAFPQVLAGVKHGTVGVIVDGAVIEITTFRREGTYRDSRHPDWVDFVDDIREDLSRRDFTINTIAYSPIRGYADPFGGQKDLAAGILRAVGEPERRFMEDALRILRGIRFAVRFSLTVESRTEEAMRTQAVKMDALARERVFEELNRLLPLIDCDQLVRFAPVIARVIPELAPMIGFDQRSPHHAYDLITHTAHVVEAVPKEETVRWAALLHDIGKVPTFTQDATGRGHFYGHAQVGAKMAEEVLTRLKAPTKLREDAVWLIDHHMTRLTPDRKLLKRYLAKFGSQRLHWLLDLQEADMGSKGTGEDDGSVFFQVRILLDAIEQEVGCLTLRDLAVNGNDLLALGYSGRQIGQCLNELLELVLDEQIPNEKEALLRQVKRREM